MEPTYKVATALMTKLEVTITPPDSDDLSAPLEAVFTPTDITIYQGPLSLRQVVTLSRGEWVKLREADSEYSILVNNLRRNT